MSEQTATERLRELLDERGVKWWEGIGEKSTVFDGEHDVRYEVDGTLGLLFIRSVLHVTPEQAIAATLERGTCELEINTDMTAIRCSKCGYVLPKGTNLMGVRYCAGCGAKVMGDVLRTE